MSYVSKVLALSPLAFWKLDEASGATSAVDSGPNTLPLTPTGTPTFGNPGFVSGLATCFTAPTNADFLFRAAAGTVLDLTAAFTKCGWFPPGLDWDYLQNTLSIMTRLFSMTGDPTHRKIVDSMVNKFLDRLNTTTWVYDYTGGTRHSGSSTTMAHFLEARQISGQRPDLTVDSSTHWPVARGIMAAGMSGRSLTLGRDLGGSVGCVLLASPQWPGIPN